MDRRQFLKLGLSATQLGAVAAIAPMALIREAMAATPTFTDYKAVVSILLHGGNDSLNMLIPTSNASGSGYHHPTYQTLRAGANLAVTNVDLDLANAFPATGMLGAGTNNPYYAVADANGSVTDNSYRKGLYDLTASKGIALGINGMMPELARLVTDNKAAIIANTGPLVEPITKNEYQNELKRRPLFLFSHNHQRRAIDTGISDNLSTIGWAGRISDQWGDINASQQFGLNYSYAGNGRMQIGNSTGPMVLKTGNPVSYYGMSIDAPWNATRRNAFAAIRNVNTTDPFKNLYNRMLGFSMDTLDVLGSNWPTTPSFAAVQNAYGNPVFTVPDQATTGLNKDIKGSLIKQLASVAEMIRIGKNTLGLKRQFFTVQLGGFDTHAQQADKHPLLLRELSIALHDFQLAMQSLGTANEVVSFTVSDFGRTTSVNSSGTDHAWGSHQFVIGGDGSVNTPLIAGGQMLGTLPDITVGGLDDTSDKGRLIPGIASDQYHATIMRWFGVTDALMPTVFPNLNNFGQIIAPGAGSAYLPLI